MFVAHIFNNPYFIYATTDKISISTNPQGVLFDATNIKPGDKFERKLTVKNEGELDFYYQSESKKVSGSDKLFNQLLLEKGIDFQKVTTYMKVVWQGSKALRRDFYLHLKMKN